MDENMLVWDENAAIKFIAARCDIDKETIAKVLELESEYMESIGIAETQSDLQSKLQRNMEPWKI